MKNDVHEFAISCPRTKTCISIRLVCKLHNSARIDRFELYVHTWPQERAPMQHCVSPSAPPPSSLSLYGIVCIIFLHPLPAERSRVSLRSKSAKKETRITNKFVAIHIFNLNLPRTIIFFRTCGIIWICQTRQLWITVREEMSGKWKILIRRVLTAYFFKLKFFCLSDMNDYFLERKQRFQANVCSKRNFFSI